jgi:inner membrane transporter RhtA
MVAETPATIGITTRRAGLLVVGSMISVQSGAALATTLFDFIWALLAAVGVVLLSGGTSGGGVDPLGVALALIAGGFWAAYILQSARVGRLRPGVSGAAGAAVIATMLVAPFGIIQGGSAILSISALTTGAVVGVLSTAIPYAAEMEALRRLPRAVFGVLMSLEPAVAAAIGFLALSQGLEALEIVAIGFVVVASAGALRSAATPAPRD